MIDYENDVYRMYWYDERIYVLEVFGRWTWADGYEAIARSNQIVLEVQTRKYGIIYLRDDAGKILSDNSRAIHHIRQILSLDDVDNELVVIIGASKLLEMLINTSSRIYSFTGRTARYRYSETFADALQLIQKNEMKFHDV